MQNKFRMSEHSKSYAILWLTVKKFILPLFTNTYALVAQVYTILLSHTAKATTHADKTFTSNKSFLFAVPPVAPFVRASDIGQGYKRLKTDDEGQGIEPWTLT